ncbi:MAG: trigger factor, partial [Clostridiales bacterium]|nr:trigger factor [Clostridiales bacterium]
ALDKIIVDSQMEIPDAMIDTQVENMIEDYAQQIQGQYGIQMDQYLQMMGMTMPKFREQLRPDALKRIQSSLVLEQIAKEEEIEISDEDFEAEIAKMAESYGMEVEELKRYMGDSEENTMKREMKLGKAMDVIGDNMIPTEAETESADEAPVADVEE